MSERSEPASMRVWRITNASGVGCDVVAVGAPEAFAVARRVVPAAEVVDDVTADRAALPGFDTTLLAGGPGDAYLLQRVCASGGVVTFRPASAEPLRPAADDAGRDAA